MLLLSGPGTRAALVCLTGREPPPPRRATRSVLTDGAGEVIDDGLVLWFPAPHSFTGEDVAELHLHGGRAVAVALAEALAELGLRPAEPGEFSRRAFLNAKLDLTRAEAIADLVDAETAAQRRQALRQMEGGLARLAEDWRAQVIRAMAHLEAVIDFADEDIPESLLGQSAEEVGRLRAELEAHLADNHRGERLRDGIHMAIIGAPNAGKSSLLNRLAGRDAAIVSAQAGTTRDVIEVHLDLGGYPLVVADTAGLRDSDDEVEQEGIRRARARAAAADIKIAVFDGDSWPHLDSATGALIDEATISVVNKLDRHGVGAPVIAGRTALALSARTGAGLAELMAHLTTLAAAHLDTAGRPTLTRQRHRAALEDCLTALRRAAVAELPELVAEDIRLAGRALGRITGRVTVDEILDVIFRDFCIGK